MFLGLDRSAYPGDAVMRSLWDWTPLVFVAPYLAPAPSHGDRAWMSAVPTLRAMGWGFAPVYVGQQASGGPGSHVLTADQGRRDAQDAARLAQLATFDTGTVLYLDIEIGGMLTSAHLGYVTAWIAEVQQQTDYWAGVYCSFSGTAQQVNTASGGVPTWVFHPIDGGPSTIALAGEVPPDPATSGFAQAIAWQYRMSLSGHVDLTWVDGATGQARRLIQVDLDSAVVTDPSTSDLVDSDGAPRQAHQPA